MRKILQNIWILLLILLLSACSTSQQASIKMISRAFELNKEESAHRLDPRFEYLRINSEGRVFYLLKAYKDQGVEVWYGGSGETLRFSDGRFVGATGLLTEWRNVVLPELPSWETLVDRGATYRWIRIRDLMPGYRYGIHDELTLNRMAPPQNTHLAVLDSKKLIWFEEVNLAKSDQLPTAVYAYDPASKSVVYGETCLSMTLCFSWQSWPKNLQ